MSLSSWIEGTDRILKEIYNSGDNNYYKSFKDYRDKIYNSGYCPWITFKHCGILIS